MRLIHGYYIILRGLIQFLFKACAAKESGGPGAFAPGPPAVSVFYALYSRSQVSLPTTPSLSMRWQCWNSSTARLVALP